METRICRKCGEEKILTAFNLWAKPDKRRHICAVCTRKAHGVWREANRERETNRAKEYRKADPSKVRQIVRRSELKVKYGLTEETFENLLKIQKGGCAICGFVFAKVRGRTELSPHVDHCHKTGVVRGLLCTNCNRGIGHLKDDFFTVIKAASYLRKFLD